MQDLVAALTGITADWGLTILGADTPTAPLGASLRETLRLQAADDPRIAFKESVAREEVPALMAAHDAVVLPSRWECWPYVALEAMSAGVPVIAPPVGGYTEMIVPGVTGERTAGPGVVPLMEALVPLVADPASFRARRDPPRSARTRWHCQTPTRSAPVISSSASARARRAGAPRVAAGPCRSSAS